MNAQNTQDEVAKLTQLPETTLLEALGLQLLAVDQPGRAAGIALHLSNTASLTSLGRESEALLPASMSGVSEILRVSRQRAEEFIRSAAPKLKEALCRDGKVRAEIESRIDKGEKVGAVIGEAVTHVLQLPPVMASVTLMVIAVLSKRGLHQYCSE